MVTCKVCGLMILMEACVAHQSLPPESSMLLTGLLPDPTGIVDRSVHEPSEMVLGIVNGVWMIQNQFDSRPNRRVSS